MKTQGSVLERCISTFLILFAFSAFGSQAFGHPLVQYWENRGHEHAGLFLEPRVSFFSTSSNYDSNSQVRSLPNSASVTQFYLDLNAAYGVSDDLFLFTRLTGISEKVTNPLQRDLSALSLGDQLIGANYRLLHLKKGLGLRFQFDAALPAYRNANALTDGKAYVGDESVDFTTGAFMEIPVGFGFSQLYFEPGAAYLYRSKGYSAAVPLSFFLKLMPANEGFLFSLGARGQVSLKTDATAGSAFGLAQALQESSRGVAGSALIDGINPSWWVAQGSAGYQNSRGLAYTLTAAMPFMGTNAPGGFQVSLGLAFALNSASSQTGFEDQTSTARPMPKRKSNQPKGFSTYDQEAKVTSVNDQLYLVKIDHGSGDNTERGQTFDIFNGNELVARARVMSVKDNEAALNVIEYYQDHWIETGFTARRLVQLN